VFFISLAILVLCLVGMLFGVRLEAVAPATGTITARELCEVRAPLGGLVEPARQEGEQSQPLQPGDIVKPGQLLATVGGEPIRAADSAECWLVLEVRAQRLQKVEAGDVLAVIVAADPQTRQPRGLIARLAVEEKHWAAVAVGQKVRLTSNVYNPRLYGHAEAVIERLEPLGEPAGEGERHFHALAPITAAPFVLPLGSGFQAEIVTGRKQVYRIIVEH
jgi:hypothetical protein